MVEAVAPDTDDPHRTRRPAELIAIVSVVAVVGFYAREWVRNRALPLVWNDTAEYVAAAQAPLVSTDRLLGLRPVLMPLVLSVAHEDQLHFVFGQEAFAAFAWALLAGVAASCFSDRPRRVVAAVGILAISLTWPVAMWDQQVLTESLALSTLAVWVAAGIWFARAPSAVRGGLLVGASFLWLLARDSHTVPVAAVGLGLLVVGWVFRVEPRRPIVLTGAYLLAIAFLIAGSAQYGHRDRLPIEHVYAVRVLPYPERVAWFADHGMPDAAELEAIPEVTDPVQGLAPFTPVAPDPRWVPWRAWLAERGRSTLLAYAAAHPSYVWSEPQASPERTFNNAGGVKGYRPLLMNEVPLVSTVWYPPVALTLAIAIAAFLVMLIRGVPWSPLAVVGTVLVVAAAPHALVVWHSDGMESARHLLVPGLQLRVGVLLLVLAAMGPSRRGTEVPTLDRRGAAAPERA